jgi:hypothetical protein
MTVRFGVVGFDLSPVLPLCLFDGLSEGVAEFLISIWVSVPLIESGRFRSVRMFPVVHGFWLGYVHTVTVGMTLTMHSLIKPVTDW